MNVAVIYRSHYGSTQKYAKWLAEDVGADLFQGNKVKPSDLEKYETIVYGGGLYAGGVNGIDLLVKNAALLQGKRLYLFTVGASSPETPENKQAIRNALQQKLPPALWQGLHIYHLRGGMCYSKMSFVHRLMMKMMFSMLRKKPENQRTDDDKAMLNAAGQDADFTNRAALAPLVADIRVGAAQG